MANNIGYTFGSKPDYTVGNIVLTAGSKDFTVTGGANLQTANILPGYTILHPNGKILVIATVASATSGTLLDNCPTDCGGTIRTLIRYQSEGSSLSAAVRDLLSGINSGLLSSMSSLAMTEGKIIVGDATAGTVKAVTLNTDNVPQSTNNQYVTVAQKAKLDNLYSAANTWTGVNTFSNALISNSVNPIQSTDSLGNKFFLRFAGNQLYLLFGSPADTSFNALRPFRIDAASGLVTMRNGLEVSGSTSLTSVNSTGTLTAATAVVTGSLNASAANLTNLFIGLTASFPATNAPAGWLKANGALVSRTSYPLLWAFAQSSGALLSEANWNKGQQGCFSVGDGSTTFRLPDLRGMFMRGLDDGRGIDVNRTIGTEQGDAIRNITGNLASVGGVAFAVSPTGAFAVQDTTQYITAAREIAGYQAGVTFNASRVVPTANENRPRNTALLVCIRHQ